MTGLPCDEHLPRATLYVTVDYCPDHQGWVGRAWVSGLTADGKTMHQGSAKREFGPFESSMDVGYWLAAQSKLLKTMSTDHFAAVLYGVDVDPLPG